MQVGLQHLLVLRGKQGHGAEDKLEQMAKGRDAAKQHSSSQEEEIDHLRAKLDEREAELEVTKSQLGPDSVQVALLRNDLKHALDKAASFEQLLNNVMAAKAT